MLRTAVTASYDVLFMPLCVFAAVCLGLWFCLSVAPLRGQASIDNGRPCTRHVARTDGMGHGFNLTLVTFIHVLR